MQITGANNNYQAKKNTTPSFGMAIAKGGDVNRFLHEISGNLQLKTLVRDTFQMLKKETPSIQTVTKAIRNEANEITGFVFEHKPRGFKNDAIGNAASEVISQHKPFSVNLENLRYTNTFGREIDDIAKQSKNIEKQIQEATNKIVNENEFVKGAQDFLV